MLPLQGSILKCLEKRVNKKVMVMFEKVEDEYNDLLSNKNIIENDKSKIKKVIEELDEKKKETLKVTWVKVNKLTSQRSQWRMKFIFSREGFWNLKVILCRSPQKLHLQFQGKKKVYLLHLLKLTV
ncbi:uncharacterized protein LOC131221735 isoform X1 [Magnolia sinica]|uniref:uncharacterized protein LOC131221735 isoform X1 n=1 Tax=Magnolia sinica TaxID=86752 RepID=UPI0026597E26|nr:uncharacterized protein LOC131221735 isoform X1 [Magnolia sinica]